MSAHDVKLFGDEIAASRVEAVRAAQGLVAHPSGDRGPLSRPDRAGVSFGADAAALLHMVSQIDKATPVIFVDTCEHFQRRSPIATNLCAPLGLTDVRSAEPERRDLRGRKTR